MKNEIERRYELLNKDDVAIWLENHAKFLYRRHQIDTYYDNKNCSFIKDINHIYDWLRIREEGNKFTLNYKHWLPEGELIRTYCEEYELEISSPKEMKNILKNIGFCKVTVVDKLRKCWLYNECEICIDSVKELGDYIEVEYQGKDGQEVNDILKKLDDVLKEVGADITNEDHEGHAIRLMRKNNLHLSAADVQRSL